MKLFKLSNEDLNQLKEIEAKQETKLHVRNRIQYLRLNHNGIKMEEIGNVFGVHYITIVRFFLKFEKEGINSIYHIEKPGCPKKLSSKEVDKIISWIEKEPRPLKEIVARIEKEFGKEISIDTLKRELKRNSYTYKRPKKSTRSFKSPDYEIKKKS